MKTKKLISVLLRQWLGTFLSLSLTVTVAVAQDESQSSRSDYDSSRAQDPPKSPGAGFDPDSVPLSMNLVNATVSEMLDQVAYQIEENTGKRPNFVCTGGSTGIAVGDLEVPEFHADAVTFSNLIHLLEELLNLEFKSIDDQPDDDLPGFYVVRNAVTTTTPLVNVPDEDESRVITTAFRVQELGDEITVDQILEQITTYLKMDDPQTSEDVTIKFHEKTGTILVRGTEKQIRQAGEMIQLLSPSALAAGTSQEESQKSRPGQSRNPDSSVGEENVKLVSPPPAEARVGGNSDKLYILPPSMNKK